jgi:hypothetical protein
MTNDTRTGLREALKLVAVTLKEGDAPFALAGGYALWARGAPESEHDVDFVVAEEDRDRAAELLRDRGLEVVQPPEDWLFKVYVDGSLVDILFRLNGIPIERETLADVDQMEVESVQMPVLAATTLMAAKLNALDEHACDLAKIIPAARAVREQVDWGHVAQETVDNDFAVVALVLLARLGVIEEEIVAQASDT